VSRTFSRRPRQGLRLLNSERRLYRMPMRKATLLSTLAHLLGPIVAVAILLLVLQIPLWSLFEAKPEKADLTFVLVPDVKLPPPERAKFRGNANQRAGGKKSEKPLKPASNSSGGSGKAIAKKAAPPRRAPAASPASVKPIAAPKPAATQSMTPPAIATPKPVETAEVAEHSVEPDTGSGGSPSGELDGLASASGGNGSGNAVGTGSGDGGVGSGQGGGGEAGLDVAQDVDFGPFMAELERRIKRHWSPPRGSSSRKVLLLFYLARDGRLVKIETKKTSGDEETDRAAIAAVVASTPFIPFPPQVKEDVLPIEFTFDYNVLNPKNTKRGLRW
jgi:TonB family protein